MFFNRIFIAIVFIVGVGCSNATIFTPDIDATVEARIATMVMPTPTPGPMFIQSEAIAIVQQYLRTRTYEVYYSTFEGGGRFGSIPEVRQHREQYPCKVQEGADWNAVYRQGNWIVTRKIDWDAHNAMLSDRLKTRIRVGPAGGGIEVDEWALNERTRLITRLKPDPPLLGEDKC